MNIKKGDMLEYTKLILDKVSFNKRLFWKEYRKSIKYLTVSESLALKFWMIETFAFRGKIAMSLQKMIRYTKPNKEHEYHTG